MTADEICQIIFAVTACVILLSFSGAGVYALVKWAKYEF